MEKIPLKKNSKTISVRVEADLAKEFHALKSQSNFDIPEAQRIVLRDLAKRLRVEASKK